MHHYPYKVDIVEDPDGTPPWERFMRPHLVSERPHLVSEWTYRPKRSGELVLNKDGPTRRFYDYSAAVKQNREDGLSGEEAASAALCEFQYFKEWCEDKWRYVGVVVTAPDGREASLWGIESDQDTYISHVIEELKAETGYMVGEGEEHY